MRVLVCPTEFKENLEVREVVAAMSEGIRRARPAAAITALPVSDGGPGLLDALQQAQGGEVRPYEVRGPLGEPTVGRILWTAAGDALCEAADACGLSLFPPTGRDPLRGSTWGVGELLGHCLAGGAASIAIGLGGSGTVDGGTGMAAALGYRFLGSDGRELPPGGAALAGLARIEAPPSLSAKLASCAVLGVSDVRTALIGPEGAARTFGPQKGAGPAEVELLERGLCRLHERLLADLGCDVAGLSGAGAAGGLGAGCAAFLGADLVAGSAWVLDRLRFDEALGSADLVVTGEGTFDATSGLGKVVWEIVQRSVRAGVPVVLACGHIAGRLPPGVQPVAGGERWLDADSLARMVANAVG